MKIYYVHAVLVALAVAMLTSVAGINVAVLLLLLATPWFWPQLKLDEKTLTVQLWGLIAALCVWDVASNLLGGAPLGRSMWAVQHDLRTFIFVVLLWPLFAVEKVAKFALGALVAAFVLVGGVNWGATLAGAIQPGEYLWRTMHHLHGQMSVGCLFLLAQWLLTRSKTRWVTDVSMALAVASIVVLLGSMLMANERRAGYFLLLAGLPVWVVLNREKFAVGRYRWWLVTAGLVVLVVAGSSHVVQSRLLLVWQEINQYLEKSPIDRANDFSSVGLRLQFYVSVWEIVKENWLLGVGSLHFVDVFQQVNLDMGTTRPQQFVNPHNEYLFMLATKGIIGLTLYLAIFVQACRLAWRKPSELQRVGLVMFVYLFMVSIFMNSMMVDMEEGHFAMLILLIFLAPKSLEARTN